MQINILRTFALARLRCYPDLIIWHNCQNCERELKGSIFDCPLIELDNNAS